MENGGGIIIIKNRMNITHFKLICKVRILIWLYCISSDIDVNEVHITRNVIFVYILKIYIGYIIEKPWNFTYIIIFQGFRGLQHGALIKVCRNVISPHPFPLFWYYSFLKKVLVIKSNFLGKYKQTLIIPHNFLFVFI